MFGFLKNFLRRRANRPVEDYQPDYQQPSYDYTPESEATYVAESTSAWTGRPSHRNGGAQPKGIELPLEEVLRVLPLELQPRLEQTDVTGLNIFVPLEKILAQLPRGAVRISFGELRQAAPGIFSLENDRDRVWVPLPLEAILSRLNP